MGLPSVIPYLVLGGFFVLYGLGILLRQEARLNFGGGRRGRNPMASARLNGLPAVIFGLSAIVGGVLAAAPGILVLMDRSVSGGMRLGLPIGGIGVMVIGMMIAIGLQASSGSR